MGLEGTERILMKINEIERILVKLLGLNVI